MSSARYFCRILIKVEFTGQSFERVSNNKFHQNPSNGSRILFRAEKKAGRRTDMTKLIVAFCNIANAPNKRL